MRAGLKNRNEMEKNVKGGIRNDNFLAGHPSKVFVGRQGRCMKLSSSSVLLP